MVSVPLLAAGDELRPHQAPVQARMTPPTLRNILESLVPIMNSLLSRPLILACFSTGCPAAVADTPAGPADGNLAGRRQLAEDSPSRTSRITPWPVGDDVVT